MSWCVNPRQSKTCVFCFQRWIITVIAHSEISLQTSYIQVYLPNHLKTVSFDSVSRGLCKNLTQSEHFFWTFRSVPVLFTLCMSGHIFLILVYFNTFQFFSNSHQPHLFTRVTWSIAALILYMLYLVSLYVFSKTKKGS